LGKAGSVLQSADGPFSLTVKTTLPNLTIAIAPPSSPPAVGNPHAYHLTITNSGAVSATGVQVQLSFSLAGTVSSATSQQGTCSLGTPVQCSLGSVAVGQTIAIDVTAVFMPDGPSPVSNPVLNVTATVKENEQDAVIADNTATLVELVGDFQLIPTPNSMTVTAGQPAGYTVAVSPRQMAPAWGPFAATVTLTCSSLPQYASCAFSPSTATPGANSVSVSLTIATVTTTTAALTPSRAEDTPVFVVLVFPLALGVLVAASSKSRRKRLAETVLLIIVLEFACLLMACGGGGGNQQQPPPVQHFTAPGTYTITINGTSGQAQRTTQVTLVVQ